MTWKPKQMIVVDGTGADNLRRVLAEIQENTRPPIDDVAHAPMFIGPLGRAWRIDLERTAKALGVSRDSLAMVESFVVEAKWSHPLWHSYLIGLHDLTPRPGLPVEIFVEGATHQLHIFALEPTGSRSKLIEGEPLGTSGAPMILFPQNWASQHTFANRLQAVEFLRDVVKDVIRGNLNPDTDNLRGLAARFGVGMVKPGLFDDDPK